MNSIPSLTIRNCLGSLLLLLLMAINGNAQITWDFETGNLIGWTKTGSAFDRQPTYQDNVQWRQPIAVNHQGRFWVGTFENHPDSSMPPGTTQGDEPQGTLTSPVFIVSGNQISLLLGGGADLAAVRAELLVRTTVNNRSRFENVRDPDGRLYSYPRVNLPDGLYYQIHANSGRNSERMERVNWPVRELQNEQARIRIVDESSGSWGHINVDDIRFDGGNPSLTAMPGDIWITNIEATQVIQTFPSNGVPLIANKPTLVRVYVAGRDDSLGRWEDVSANLTVSRGTRGPQVGSTVRPANGTNTLGRITVSPSGSDRRRFDDSLNFILYPEQTAEGPVRLEVEIFSFSRRAESETANNRFTKEFYFHANPGFGFVALSYAYTTAPDTTAPPFSDFEPHRVWAESALPMAALWSMPYPGYPRGSIAHRQVRNDDGTFRDDGYLDGRAWAHQMIDRWAPSGGEWVVLMQPEVDPSYHGAHYVNFVGNHVINMQSNYSDPGPTLAHEIGHGWRQPHTWDNGNFPHASGGMGGEVGVRIFRSGVELLNSPRYYDLMSYGHPSWFSPYSYTEILRHMTRDRLTVPEDVRDARWQSHPGASGGFQFLKALYQPDFARQSKNFVKSRSYLYVSGRVDSLEGGTATFFPFEKITLSKDLAGLQAGTAYRLALEDSNGKSLVEYSFDKPDVADDRADSGFLFSMYLPMDMATSQITLRDKSGKVLAQRSVSANSPELKDLVCKCDQSMTGKQLVSWQGSDADGDSLTYSVWYSTDGGEKWLPLQVGLTEPSLEVDFDNLPGSNEAMIRVLGSDGVNTTEIRSAETFRVPTKVPRVEISTMQGVQAGITPRIAGTGSKGNELSRVTISTIQGAQSGNTPRIGAAGSKGNDLLVAEAQPVLLRGSAFDLEDGPFTYDSALQWTSDRDGRLGTGSWLVLSSLSRGRHRITLTALDSQKTVGRASIQVTVRAR